jgi:hypothetical protein
MRRLKKCLRRSSKKGTDHSVPNSQPQPQSGGPLRWTERSVPFFDERRIPRFAFAIAAILLLLLAPGCRIRKKATHAQAPEDDGQLVSVINMGDPRAAVQLTRGFHALENQSWRWTMKDFTATLRPPARASASGASLQLKFTIPDVMFNRVGPMAVNARVNGLDLGPQTYSQTGDFIYTRDVPATALSGDAVSVDFHVDKGLPPSDQDTRELAIIVTAVGLLPK